MAASETVKKCCSRCKEWKDLSSFHNDSSRGDGLSAKCKTCDAECRRLRRQKCSAATTKLRRCSKNRQCSKCKEVKPLKEFYRDRSSRTGYTSWCVACQKQFQKSYHARLSARKSKNIPCLTVKFCSKCHQSKPVSEFHVAQGKPDGYSAICRACSHESSAAYRNTSKKYTKRRSRRFESIASEKSRKCPACARLLPLSAFNFDRASHDGHASYCRECALDYTRQHYEENRDAYSERSEDYRRKHPQRLQAYRIKEAAVKNGQLVPPENCSKCGKPANVLPLWKDYSKPLDIKWLCRRCHRQQHAERRRLAKAKTI